MLVGQAIDGYRKKFVFRATLTDGVLRLTIQSDTLELTRVRFGESFPARRGYGRKGETP